MIVDRAGLWDAETLSDVAAATFPLACPPETARDDIDLFLAQTLSGERFGEYLNDATKTVLKAVADAEIVGYAMLIAGEPTDPAVTAVVTPRPVLEINKMYVLPGHHSTGVSTALMHATLAHAREEGFAGVWLGVNQQNHRAQRFYAKHGFVVVGRKTFSMGREVHDDFVMQLPFS
ncbi:GNAT family N-acetyltransferase [Nocardia callitridis]|uniref:GNAT family N-acetyltransferase n=1 Tax=Nocardia callitridis TaxID=648753 RepID=A0ABP9KDX5_9NOCA